jgi:hypothetical protein
MSTPAALGARPPEFACRCGAARVAVDLAAPHVHVVCYCDDCRAYLCWLRREELSDAHGGSEILQLAPANVRLVAGGDHLAWVRLTERGPFRFFAACCNTPLGNSVPRVPFVGLVTAGLGIRLASRPAGIQARFALDGAPPGAHARASLPLIARGALAVARSFILRRGRPTPFFDDAGAPRGRGRLLTRDERRACADP